MSSSTDAERFVVSAGLVSAIVIAARALRGGNLPAARPAMGLTVATVMLLLIAPKAPKLATAFAASMTVGVLFAAGSDTIAGFGNLNAARKKDEPRSSPNNVHAVENEGVTVVGSDSGQIIG